MNHILRKLVRRTATSLAIGMAFSLGAGSAFAQVGADSANLQKLGAFKKTDTPPPKR